MSKANNNIIVLATTMISKKKRHKISHESSSSSKEEDEREEDPKMDKGSTLSMQVGHFKQYFCAIVLNRGEIVGRRKVGDMSIFRGMR